MVKTAEIDTISARVVDGSTVQYVGKQLFNQYGLPIEAISVLLLAAVGGGIVLAKKWFDRPTDFASA